MNRPPFTKKTLKSSLVLRPYVDDDEVPNGDAEDFHPLEVREVLQKTAEDLQGFLGGTVQYRGSPN